MSALVSGEVYGVREALAILRQTDDKVYWRAVNHLKAAGSELVDVVADAHPPTSEVKTQMRGWSQKGRLGYDQPKIRKGITVKVGGRAGRGGSRPLITVVSKNAGGALFALAGMADGLHGLSSYSKDRLGRARHPNQSKAFLRTINQAFGPAQRGGWRKIAKLRSIGETRIIEACEDVAQWANRKLVR